VEPTVYEICVKGRLTERMAVALEGMTMHPGAVDSVFIGEVRHQSQLFGHLERLRDLGLELISVLPQGTTNENSPPCLSPQGKEHHEGAST